jgi:Bacterial mobilisation protein (MobC)
MTKYISSDRVRAIQQALLAKSQTPLDQTEIRDINIVFRATKTEQKLLDECCEGLVDRSTYMRSAIFGTPRPRQSRGIKPVIPEINRELLYQIKRIGNNINQLTKILHDRPNLRTLDRYSTEIVELKELLNRIQRELTNPQLPDDSQD